MDVNYCIMVYIKNENNEKKYIDYFYDFNFTTKNDKLIFKSFKPKIKSNKIIKLIISDSLYFNTNSGYYNDYFVKTNYKTIKEYNKIIFEINANDITNIIKNNKLFNKQYYKLYLVKKDKELNLFFINDGILNIYTYVNKEFILHKKFMYYKNFLVDEDDKLFCIRNYEILSIKQFRQYNHTVNLVKCKYSILKANSIYTCTTLPLYDQIYYRHYKDNINEVNLFLDSIYIGRNNINFENNKIKLSCKNIFLLII